jgi:uncharacterized protein (DUF433 family)
MNTTVSEKVLSKLSRVEKVELVHWLIKDLTDDFDGIEKTANVCGGSARIKQTRIPVWSLENARRQGITEAELLQDFPSLTAQDLANAWVYVRSNLIEIEREIDQNEDD